MAYGQRTRPKILSIAITMFATRPNMILAGTTSIIQ